jgi:outer membrane protein W
MSIVATNRIAFLIAATLLANVSFAQLENKMTAYVFLGVPIIKKAGNIQAENIYNGYSPLPYLGLGINYNLNARFSIGANLKQLVTKKANYGLTNTNFGIGAKLNIIPMDKKISPFVYAEGNLGYITISQKANSSIENPTVDDPEHVKITQQTRNYPEIKTGYSCTGAMVGVGLDFTLKLKYGVFVSANYMLTNADKTFTSKNNFAENTSKFQFLMIQTGFRFSFGKSKSLY